MLNSLTQLNQSPTFAPNRHRSWFIKISSVMTTYTPTHCPATGRKLTKVERSIANKAKYAAGRQAAATPTRKVKYWLSLSKDNRIEHSILLNKSKAELVEMLISKPQPEPTSKPKASKPKAVKAKRKPKASKAKLKAKTIRKPKRSSNAGLEQAQAQGGVGVGTPAKTKVVHAVTEGEPQPFEPRKAVVVTPSPAKRAAVKEVFTLLDGESPQEAIRRQRILAERERSALEAELLMNTESQCLRH